MKTTILNFLLGLTLLTGAARAQTAFTYQGKLVDDCCPASGSYDLHARLYSAPIGGSAVPGTAQLSLPAVFVTNGLFTASLDFGSAPFDGSRRWLELDVRTNNTGSYVTLAPRTELTPTPNALFAHKAGSLTSGAITATTLAPAPAQGQVLTYNAGALRWSSPSSATGWSLTGNDLAPGQFLGTINNIPLEIRAPNGVGIGTATPSSSLHLLNSGSSTYLTLEKSSQAYESGLRFLTAGANRWWIFADDTSDDLQLQSAGEGDAFPRIRLPSANHDVLLGLSGGYVGVGTAAPAYALDVAGEVHASGAFVASSAYTGNYGTVLSVPYYSRKRLLSSYWRGDLGDYVDIEVPGNDGPGNVMRITSRGNVGIGTTTPGASLDVRDGSGPNGDGGIIHVGGTGYNGDAKLIRFGDGDYVHIGESGSDDTMELKATRFNFIGGGVTVPVLTITGGADLAEPFQMSEEKIQEGSVVIIDEEHPGHLKQATRAYDTRVAGIVSGANGVKAGIALHQEGMLEGGQNVALTGRVYVKADASHGAIKPGDLLTTSDTPGHAMKVSDPAKAQGAILGKAMTALSEGTGMVLVLVSLQ